MLELVNIIRYKSGSIYRKLTRNYNYRKINNSDFTIISNNCWGGHVYRYFGLGYNSPTVGLYFYADEYVKFVNNIKYYLDCELEFISYKDSKYRKDLEEKQYYTVPIGKLDDVEIVFLHYKDEKEAKEKWNRRKKRVNYDNIILKFSQQNLCEDRHLEWFDNLDFSKKVMFVNSPDNKYDCSVYYRGYEDKDEVLNDTRFFYSYMNLVDFINQPVCSLNNSH